jgi:hypothetical protein
MNKGPQNMNFCKNVDFMYFAYVFQLQYFLCIVYYVRKIKN